MKSKALSLHPMKFKDAIKKIVKVRPASKSENEAKPGDISPK